jgi:hypothetical protein
VRGKYYKRYMENSNVVVLEPDVHRLAGHGATLFAGLSKLVDLKLATRLEFGSGAVAMQYEPRR